MHERNVALNRTLAGILAIACGIAGIALCATRGMQDQFGAGFIRVSLVLGALWCAMPTSGREAAWARVSPWTVIGGVLAVVVALQRLRIFLPIALVLIAVGYFLRPRKRRSPRSSR